MKCINGCGNEAHEDLDICRDCYEEELEEEEE